MEYYNTIDTRRVISAVEPGYLRPALPDGIPQEGERWEKIQEDIEAKIVPGLTHWYAIRERRGLKEGRDHTNYSP